MTATKVRQFVDVAFERRPYVNETEKNQLAEILCTSEGVLSVNEVFGRFEEWKPVQRKKQAWLTTQWIASQERILDQMSELNRECRREL